MSFKLAIKDINFIRPLWKYYSFLIITPWYNFDQNCLYNPYLIKLYGFIFLVINVTWIVSVICDQSLQQVYTVMPFSHKCLYILTCVNIKIFMFLIIVKACFWDVDKWRVLVTNFRYIDERLENRGRKEVGILRNFYCGFAIKEIFFLLFALYEMYIWSIVLEFSFLKGIVMGPLIDLYYEFQMVIFITCIVNCIKSRYEDLNSRILKLYSDKNIVRELRKLIELYRILGEIIEVFNKLFGYQIILVIFHSGLQVISSLNFCFMIITKTDGPLYHHFIVANISVLFITIVSKKNVFFLNFISYFIFAV